MKIEITNDGLVAGTIVTIVALICYVIVRLNA